MNPDYMTDEVYSRRLLAVDSDAVLLHFVPCARNAPPSGSLPAILSTKTKTTLTSGLIYVFGGD